MPKPSNGKDDADGADDSETITEETLRRDKEKLEASDVETSTDEDETTDDDDLTDEDSDGTGDDDGKADEDSQDEDSDDDSSDDSDDDDSDTFVKQFDNIKGDTLPEYTRNLEKAYANSSTEATKLLKKVRELEAKDTTVVDDAGTGDDKSGDKKPKGPQDPLSLYMKGKMDEEIVTAYTDFAQDYDQVDDPAEYNKFTKTVAQLTKTIMDSEGRMAPPRELYSKASVILGWKPKDKKPNSKEKAGMALKDRAGTSKGSAGPKKPGSKSNVTQAMIELNRKMYPGKTDAQIREELEPFV